jgi:phosphatidate cytidylyltransferase
MKTRILSGLVAVLLLVIVLILHGTFVYPLCIGLISALAVSELFRADHCTRYTISLLTACVVAVATPIFRYYGLYGWENLVLVVGVMLLFFDFVQHHKARTFYQTAFMMMAMALVTYSMNLLVTLLHMNSKFGLVYVILALCAAWISDTGAYFTGTWIGKRKLCPEISPKKTVEGFLGGIAVDIIVMILVSVIYGWIAGVHVQYLWLIVTAAVCSVAGVLGDLSASLIKRQRNIKDFGKIMPGHGGVMDRFDSVLFTIPVFYACVSAIPIYSV